MFHTFRTRRALLAAGLFVALSAVVTPTVAAAAPDFSGFTGTWTSAGGTVSIGPGGTGTETLADNAQVQFRLTSVDNSIGDGMVTRSSNSGDAAVGAPISVWTTALGDGPLLTVVTGSSNAYYCSQAVVTGGECVA
ncbi:hypothetical protein HH308_03155 [Gordonia sp. TBRC 11910]|uniref:Uncharacterized protein n=1 Tax=Gordonia asplenii TaxID=2725283 RepID=A0A848KPG4_9ACTN|nr:hypothetical protein [Gordonia asplenii]NMO00210.1 hypothetical protein [Gordonia asplenii]